MWFILLTSIQQESVSTKRSLLNENLNKGKGKGRGRAIKSESLSLKQMVALKDRVCAAALMSFMGEQEKLLVTAFERRLTASKSPSTSNECI